MDLELTFEERSLLCIVAGLLGMIVFSGSLVSGALLLGFLSSFSVLFLFSKLDKGLPRVYEFLLRHSILTDLIMTGAFAVLFGTTVTGLIAAATSGIVCSTFLSITKKSRIIGGCNETN